MRAPQPPAPREPSSRRRHRAFVLGLAALASLPAAATNRFFNPEFDQDVSGWTEPDGGATWDPEDRDACSLSGSALTTGVQFIGSDYITFLPQCIPVNGGETISVRIDTRVVFATQPVHGSIEIRFVTGDCLETPAALFGLSFVAPFGTWSRAAASFVVPPAMTGALVVFRLDSAAEFDALWDRAHASDQTSEIFADAFEIGELCRWGGP